MSIECYHGRYKYHSCNYINDGPFCDEPECHIYKEVMELIDSLIYHGRHFSAEMEDVNIRDEVVKDKYMDKIFKIFFDLGG
jgi:hypothetical protein